MDKLNRFNGAMVIFSLICWTIIRSGETFLKQPTWWGGFSAACQIGIGCMAITSVWRDRL